MNQKVRMKDKTSVMNATEESEDEGRGDVAAGEERNRSCKGFGMQMGLAVSCGLGDSRV